MFWVNFLSVPLSLFVDTPHM